MRLLSVSGVRAAVLALFGLVSVPYPSVHPKLACVWSCSIFSANAKQAFQQANQRNERMRK